MNDLKELNIDEKQKFDNFYICKPFISEENIQVPVRIYNQDLYIDLSIYLNYDEDYKIKQIEIIKWGMLHGETGDN